MTIPTEILKINLLAIPQANMHVPIHSRIYLTREDCKVILAMQHMHLFCNLIWRAEC